MFGKLFKYDFRSMLKQFAFVWPAALVLALLNRFTVNSFVTSASSVKQAVSGVAMLVYIGILIAMFVIAVIFVIQRFYKGLLGDEGYLMHTLPVKPWQLIGSKLLCAVVVTVVSILVAILSILLIVPAVGESFQEFLRTWTELTRRNSPHFTLLWVELIVYVLVGMAGSYLQLYLSMGIGHLFHKNRVAWSIAAYIAISALLNIIYNTAGRPLSADLNEALESAFFYSGDWSRWHTVIWTFTGIMVIRGALFYVLTNYILKKKLNLE